MAGETKSKKTKNGGISEPKILILFRGRAHEKKALCKSFQFSSCIQSIDLIRPLLKK